PLSGEAFHSCARKLMRWEKRSSLPTCTKSIFIIGWKPTATGDISQTRICKPGVRLDLCRVSGFCAAHHGISRLNVLWMSARVATGKPRRYRAAYRQGELVLTEKGRNEATVSSVMVRY